MASWTDILPTFKPYVQQLPVEAMVQVGMQKQAQYNAGIQKIQGEIDKIAGLDIYRDVDKNYLQSKLNELGDKMTFFAAGDFSDFQLTNSVAGMTNQLTKDPIVQTAVQSTAMYRENKKRIKKDVDEGKTDPSNIYRFDRGVSQWLNSGKPGESLNAEYIPYFDVFKFAKETFDAVKPDGYSFDQIYQLGADGKPLKDGRGNLILNPAMTRMEKEGIFPEKVKQTLDQVFSDPRVAQQLQITGEYVYRGNSGTDLYEKVLQQKDELVSAYEEKLTDLRMQKNLGKDVQKQIDELESSLTKVSANYDEYSKLALENPDVVRAQMYKDDVTSRYTTMFGWTKSKEQLLENPRWRAEFDMQKEANEQSRFAQRLQFDMTQEQNSNYWKQKEYDQRERFKTIDIELSKKGKGKSGEYGGPTGPGDEVPEQGNQFADIDKLRMFERNYEQATTNFINSSDRFIWETTGLANLPRNVARKNELIKSGKSEDEAIHIMLNDLAKQTGESPEDWRARWGVKATTAYQNMTATERQKNPALSQFYNQYSTTRKIFDNERAVKKQVEAQTISQVGDVANVIKLTEDIPSEQTVVYNGNQVKLTKDDVYDMAVYLRGYKSSLGFLNDDGARQAAKVAYQRLKLRGKSELADEVLNFEGSSGSGVKGPITRLVRTAKSALSNVFSGGTSGIPGVSMNQLGAMAALQSVNRVLKKIDTDEYQNELKVKASIVDRAYGIKPNLKVGLMTGDNETDKGTVYRIQRLAGEYSTMDGGRNVSPDFEEFAKKLESDPAKNILSAQVALDAEGNPKVEIVSYDLETKKRIGGMTIQPDEAAKFNIDINSIYEPREVSSLRSYINYNGGQTSAGNIKAADTYISGDVYFNQNEFPKLQNSKYRMQANIKYSGGLYIPYVYVTDGNRKMKEARELPPLDNLAQVVGLLKEMDPTIAEKFLIEK